MPLYETKLSLEYFAARNLADRTAATLTAIVQHVCATNALSPSTAAVVQEEAHTLARHRGLLREEETRKPSPRRVP
jgi:hypothetical protein